MTTRIKGFYKLSPQSRLEYIAKYTNLKKDEVELLIGQSSFTEQNADRMIENAIGYIPIPLGVAANFKIDGKDTFIPMATEEPSVIAAASNAAKHTYSTGGFKTSYSGSIMRGQVQLTNLSNPYAAMAMIYENKHKIIEHCNEHDQTLVSLGGGAKDLEVHVIDSLQEKMVVVHLLVDTKDAMGANAVNTMAEAAAPLIKDITGGTVVLRILSNLADQRIVRVRAIFKEPFNGDNEAIEKFIQAYELALKDPYRATTHNKGIMNGISAVVLATGNDTRAVEAGAHAYAARSGTYQPLTYWEKGDDHSLIGTLEIPLAVGIIGGATSSHPVAKLATKILQIQTAEQLSSVIGSVGLAQNFAALRALANEGLQRGHMKLHIRNFAIMAGAPNEQIEEVVNIAEKHGKFKYDDIKNIVNKLSKS